MPKIVKNQESFDLSANKHHFLVINEPKPPKTNCLWLINNQKAAVVVHLSFLLINKTETVFFIQNQTESNRFRNFGTVTTLQLLLPSLCRSSQTLWYPMS